MLTSNIERDDQSILHFPSIRCTNENQVTCKVFSTVACHWCLPSCAPLTFDEAFDFHKNLARKNGIGFDKLLRRNLKMIKTKLLPQMDTSAHQ